MEKARCEWVGSDDLMIAYHDTEWGVPVHDDRKLFEVIVLDAMQAGLNWHIVLQIGQDRRAKPRAALGNRSTAAHHQLTLSVPPF
jgi:DNA-3-methyladenine glycosylase I